MGDNTLRNVIIPSIDPSERWDIEIADGRILNRAASSSSSSTSPPSLLLPPLCHPHIHLDKPYLLTSNRDPSSSHPDYSDLLPTTGDFQEALANTSAAKARFTYEDLYLRGSQLLAESYARGVTAMRVFVEVDRVVKTTNLRAAVQLKKDFQHLIHVQICVFAQDPLFSTEHGSANLEYMLEALETFVDDVEALGTTPYVEQDRDGASRETNQRKNIEWAVGMSMRCRMHLDFHLDYNLDASEKGMLRSVVEELARQAWAASNDGKTVVIGHCTHLTTYGPNDLEHLAVLIKTTNAPIHFVGLPTSDLYMMGRTSSSNPEATPEKPHERPRGTMQVPSMIKQYDLDGCIGVNNVGNAFTPYGDGDPLQLACWGTGIYHAGTVADAELLYDCISGRARRAIGVEGLGPLGAPDTGHTTHAGHTVYLPGLLIQNRESMVLPGRNVGGFLNVPARQRLSIRDVVWDPPGNGFRKVLR